MRSGTRARASFEDALTRNVQTLRGRLITGALIALVVLTALALGLVWRQYEDAKREAAIQLRARAILAATVFDTYFAGQLAALSAIAASPTVMAGDTEAMTEYFSAFRHGKSTFTAGVGWIDVDGRQRATSDPRGPIQASLPRETREVGSQVCSPAGSSCSRRATMRARPTSATPGSR